MPIKPEHRHHYRKSEWREACRIVDARAGGRCERCQAPNGYDVVRVCGTQSPQTSSRAMYWRLNGYLGSPWISEKGEELNLSPPQLYNGARYAPHRRVRVVLTHAHLNQDPSDHSPENIQLLCRYCHIKHDAPAIALHAAETRKDKKDAARGIIAASLATELL